MEYELHLPTGLLANRHDHEQYSQRNPSSDTYTNGDAYTNI